MAVRRLVRLVGPLVLCAACRGQAPELRPASPSRPAAQTAAELDARIAALEAAVADQQALLLAQQADIDQLTSGHCPSGYEQGTQATAITLCTRYQGRDQMVRVGDFWVDRYEASVWSGVECEGTPYGESPGLDDYPAAFPDNGNVVPPAAVPFACSRVEVPPSAMLTWFQAAQACVAAGKELVTDAQWQAAVAGTVDPGANDGGVNAGCNTATTSGVVRATGFAGGTPAQPGTCVSLWGVEDMIGNLWEMTADWHSTGLPWQDSAFTDSAGAHPWPAGYGTDGTYNLNGRATGPNGWQDGRPAMAMRGGDFGSGADAGAFALSLSEGPDAFGATVGFRCARSR
jgi:formylglycine-generating enzyme required for sulfatase activity